MLLSNYQSLPQRYEGQDAERGKGERRNGAKRTADLVRVGENENESDDKELQKPGNASSEELGKYSKEQAYQKKQEENPIM